MSDYCNNSLMRSTPERDRQQRELAAVSRGERLDEINAVMIHALHKSGEWETPSQDCTQCEDTIRLIRSALEAAGYEIVAKR